MLLQGKKAIITGGARGIGKEIVESFLKEGASVYFIDLMASEFMSEYEALAADSGTQVVYKECNVADEDQVIATVKAIVEESGGIDILVNNAGITRDGLIFRMPKENWNDVISVNLNSAFFMSKAIARSMISNRNGAIINVSSIVGVHGNAGQCNYSASKAGLIGLTKSLAQEVGGRNVRVNAVAPGFIQTAMTDKLSDEQKEALQGQIPMVRLGQPEEVAKVILFLASDLASYVTGQVILIDGGMGM
ncbi:MAG: 3-oxoacyl-[acyl-carrier-protein] reductase [Spirochaetales bacterium]|jgi:3-oxoacyl-[acyl-carrier protein] reductase|nr:3-oxoacyl-[acyl-carrier-protein] reductase [Spirochaetales bacterium]